MSEIDENDPRHAKWIDLFDDLIEGRRQPEEEPYEEVVVRGMPRSAVQRLNLQLGEVYNLGLIDQATGQQRFILAQITGVFLNGYAYIEKEEL